MAVGKRKRSDKRVGGLFYRWTWASERKSAISVDEQAISIDEYIFLWIGGGEKKSPGSCVGLFFLLVIFTKDCLLGCIFFSRIQILLFNNSLGKLNIDKVGAMPIPY